MSVVKINVIAVPEGAGPELEARFAARLGAVENMPGFEGFELLRPAKGGDRYFVYTRWASEEHFQAWMNSQDFERGHGSGQAAGNQPADGEAPRKPVAQGADLMSFEVVEHVVKGS